MRRLLPLLALAVPAPLAAQSVDFNRDVRPILSNNCFACHGPDEKVRKADLRLDTQDGATADRDGSPAIVPGKPEASPLVERITAADPSELMPPPKTGKRLSKAEIDILARWVKEGGKYSRHWAYVPPVRPELPPVKDTAWVKNPIDRFILARLEKEGLKPMPEADRYALARRLALDLTGLPPTLAEADAFAKDTSPDAYEKYVDLLLRKESYGEHWARVWLDLARYADSAGYADDPPRQIWAFRDYVIKSFNANKPFDRFTIEQIAGDLLPNPTEEQLVATAFHRNTMTNNEGGTNDEEFRNVAVVDRVNTTLTTWMGTSIACAQCHNHKYDPISQKEYFGLFAILNNTADADRSDEAPVYSFYTEPQKKQRAAWEAEVAAVEKKFKEAGPKVLAGREAWEKGLALNPWWGSAKPQGAKSKTGLPVTIRDSGAVFVEKAGAKDTYTVEVPLTMKRLTGLKLEALTDPALPGMGPGHAGGNFVISKVTARLVPPAAARPAGRYVRLSLPGKDRILSLAEVQVFSGSENVAPKGEARQSSTDYDGPARLAIDGNTDGKYASKSVTHTKAEADPWWEVDLKGDKPVDRVVVWNRLDGVEARLAGYRVELLNEKREVVWKADGKAAPKPSAAHETNGARPVTFTAAYADYEQAGFPAAAVLDESPKKKNGWAVGGSTGKPHTLTLLPGAGVDVPDGSKLLVTIEQNSPQKDHLLGHFRLSVTNEPAVAESARLPTAVLAALAVPADKRTDPQKATISDYYVRSVAPELKADRDRLAELKKSLSAMKPNTVPIMKELAGAERRKTRLQHRGNFLDLGEEVKEGVPAALNAGAKPQVTNRLELAKWLVAPDNPLTARVMANRYWEQIFGIGLVRTSEEFGIQGELPSHPELLDWLATELIRLKWDLKAFVKLLVTSATYRQSSKVTKESAEHDPDNRLLARGPRLRLTAEMVRDQALFASGLLSHKMYGPSVKPPQPTLGLNAAFGGSIDWQTSPGEDKYRRGLYTDWRRSNPYPAMSTFDAPNRDVCVVRRNRTNTPLQALVTLNDVVYVEAAQALARRAVAEGGATPAERAAYTFRQCLVRPPHPEEVERLVRLFEEAKAAYAKDPAQAKEMATNPRGPVPAGMDVTELAAWTVVANVVLNLDETLMKR
jgi:mono/diheme cytochrome c family protein